MSDNLRRYRAIKAALKELHPGEPRGNQVRHLHTLAAFISGIVGSKSTHLPAIAAKVPDGTKKESRGFNLHKSHISDLVRLARLMIAACLAYIWIIYLGVIAKRDDWVKVIHRTDRCDLSLFQLGLNLLDHFLNEGLPIPVAFRI